MLLRQQELLVHGGRGPPESGSPRGAECPPERHGQQKRLMRAAVIGAVYGTDQEVRLLADLEGMLHPAHPAHLHRAHEIAVPILPSLLELLEAHQHLASAIPVVQDPHNQPPSRRWQRHGGQKRPAVQADPAAPGPSHGGVSFHRIAERPSNTEGPETQLIRVQSPAAAQIVQPQPGAWERRSHLVDTVQAADQNMCRRHLR